MNHDTTTCGECGGALETPFEKARGTHRDCGDGGIEK